MRVLHLASYDEWTGAAAIALEETLALRAAGYDAHFAYMGDEDLESRVGHNDYTHPILSKSQDPVSVMGSIRAIRRLHSVMTFDVFHSHLSHDHWLALAARRGRTTLCRTYHAARALRNDVVTRSLIRWTDGIGVSNQSLAELSPLRGVESTFLPPTVDLSRFRSDGESVRLNYSVPDGCRLLGSIGKIDANRGFSEVIDAFAYVAKEDPRCELMVIGDGVLKETFVRSVERRGLSHRVRWTGFRDEDLPEHYRAMDLLLYVTPGSEEGHRAVIEALSCGTPVAAFGVPGIEAVLGDLGQELVVDDGSPRGLGERASSLLQVGKEALTQRCVGRASNFSRPRSAERLAEFYQAARSKRTKSLKLDLR